MHILPPPPHGDCGWLHNTGHPKMAILKSSQRKVDIISHNLRNKAPLLVIWLLPPGQCSLQLIHCYCACAKQLF